ncbi:MAG TPA: pyridoxamine 5'-phosphate oxidase family protein [Gaiellaceae bacterium]|nr:pyridoxamine 5'-phosphate oxidase family protein [Gaiellaceae bacterium]
MDEMRGLRDDEVERFLSLPLVATLATYRRNATVLLSPVWQEWATEAFHVLLSRDDIKANHVRDNPRVGIVVYEHAPPYRGVEASGMGTLVDGIYGDVLARMGPRYLPDGLPTQLASDGVVLKLVPERLRSWTFEEWFSDHSGQTQ